MKRFRCRYLILSALLLFFTSGCCKKENNSNQLNREGGKELIKYAKHLSILQFDGYLIARIIGSDNNVIATYLLEGENTTPPDAGDIVVSIPIKSIVVNTEANYNLLRELGADGIVAGVTDAPFFKSTHVKNRIAEGELADIGASTMPVAEKVLALKPDLVMTDVYEGMSIPSLQKYGIEYLKLADNLEPTPLARAEWMKLLGVLTGKSAEADSIFESVKNKYNAIVKINRTNERQKPKVIIDKMFQGVWHTAAGRSYMAELLNDAGANYPWKENKKGGSLALSLEEVYAKGGDADIWLIRNYGQLSKKNLLDEDSRYAKFKAFRDNKIYVADTESSTIFEDQPYHPEMILEEFISIVNDEKGNNNLKYFSKMK